MNLYSKESLTPIPELENSLGYKPKFGLARTSTASA